MNKLKELRLKNNLTQLELSQKTGVNIRTIQNFEQGQNDLKSANVGTVYKILQVLNTTIEDYFKDKV